jgi:hypothetical protein
MACAHSLAPTGARTELPIVAALQPNPLLGFLMQAAALGAFLGTLVGYWRRRNNDKFDTFPIVTRWTVPPFWGASPGRSGTR